MKFEELIGIDPDVNKSGVACYCPISKRCEVSALSFWNLIGLLKNELDRNIKFKVYLEAGWLNKKSNYHFVENRAASERIAQKVGRNHQLGLIIQEYLDTMGISYELVKPTTTKWTSKQCFQITGLQLKNQDCIDAVKLVWGR